jgi:uncharacterized protein YecT (DUF1311 family)
MRSRIAALATAALIGAAVSASGAEEPEKSCANSTYEIVECQKAELAALDKRLNAAYGQALQDAQSAKQREQLRAAQRLWLQYREANCMYYELGEGTIARIEGGQCMLDLTRMRTKELEGVRQP